MKLDAENQVQPDGYMWKLNSQCNTDDNNYIVGAPEFVCEVVANSVARNTTAKLYLYQEVKAKKYVIWTTVEQEVYWYCLVDGRY